MKFVLFHGAFVTPDDSWYPWLGKELKKLGQEFFAPQFPVDLWKDVENLKPGAEFKKQSLSSWMKVFERFKSKEIKREDQLCFIGHSTGPLFILHVLSQYNIKLDSAIFVCPFLERLGGPWQTNKVNETFYKADFDFKRLRELIPLSFVIRSDNDPYVPEALSIEFAQKVESQTIIAKGGGHLSGWFGYSEFPLILELCKTRFKV